MIKVEKELKSQAERIIEKFGGAYRLSRAMKIIDPMNFRSHVSIYRWTYPRSKGGTGGIIPTSALPLVIKAARIEGVMLTAEDLHPGAH